MVIINKYVLKGCIEFTIVIFYLKNQQNSTEFTSIISLTTLTIEYNCGIIYLMKKSSKGGTTWTRMKN
jgi:hypothetical protein